MGQSKIVLAGCGNMGFAMLQGWLADGVIKADNLHVVEPTDALRTRAAKAGAHVHASAADLPPDFSPEVIVLAVKPQVIGNVLKDYHPHAEAGATVLSVAAGVRIAAIEAALGVAAPIIRVMPNTPAAIGKGMMVMCDNGRVSETTRSLVADMLSASGEVATIEDEGLMDAVTALSGSGPAYVFHMIEAMTDAGAAAGLPQETAKLLAMQTVYGAASYAKESGEEPGMLREQVTSPNGTTAAALSVLMGEDRLKQMMREAVEAARKRSVELGE